jgi:hypothetical protein
MSAAVTPELSVIVLVPDVFATVSRVVGHLAEQDACREIEAVFVGPRGFTVPDAAVARFGSWQVVPVERWQSTAEARASGVWKARAPIVAFVEDHCFPTAGWARALIDAHLEQDWAGVGPVILNANPSSTVSWANLLIEYGPWLHPCQAGVVRHMPGHNSSYKRARLLPYGDALPTVLEAESVLHWDLERQGHHVALEPRARSRHENFTRVLPSLRLRFFSGRLFAGNRSRGWSFSRRVLYAMGSTALPMLRTWRAYGDARRVAGRSGPWVVPTAFLLLVADALGEAAGYARGPGRAMAVLVDLEFHRERFMASSEVVPS